VPDFDELYHSYCEAVHSLDENIGRVADYLRKSGQAEDTLVIYMGDNGFHLGEHGFYDKRDAFETSIRVPMVAWAPGLITPGAKIGQMVQNIDIAPTILEACGSTAPASAGIDGKSFLPLLLGRDVPGRDYVLYEYHWEWNFPATPSMFAIRTERFKYVYYHGVWDHDSFYDLESDPLERHNLIHVPAYAEQIRRLKKQLFSDLATSGALSMPVHPPAGDRLDQRKLSRAP
jgi:N-acetylglucosamine-6-sulfatase